MQMGAKGKEEEVSGDQSTGVVVAVLKDTAIGYRLQVPSDVN